MKKFLRAISLIMVFAMILAMFTACGETHSARNNTQKDAKLLAIVIA